MKTSNNLGYLTMTAVLVPTIAIGATVTRVLSKFIGAPLEYCLKKTIDNHHMYESDLEKYRSD